MNKAEKFIQDYTRNCSNEILSPYPQIIKDVRRIDGEPAKEFSPWLTPDQARRAVEIAREEIIEKATKWLNKLSNYNAEFIHPSHSGTIENFVNSFKQAMKDE